MFRKEKFFYNEKLLQMEKDLSKKCQQKFFERTEFQPFTIVLQTEPFSESTLQKSGAILEYGIFFNI